MKDIEEKASAIFMVVPREPGDPDPDLQSADLQITFRREDTTTRYYNVCSYHIVRYRIVQYRARPVCSSYSVSSTSSLLLRLVVTDTGTRNCCVPYAHTEALSLRTWRRADANDDACAGDVDC